MANCTYHIHVVHQLRAPDIVQRCVICGHTLANIY